MNAGKFILRTAFLFYSFTLQAAVIDVCDLANKGISGAVASSEISPSQIQDYQNKLNRECDLSRKFKNLNGMLQSKYGISLTDVAEYQAIRFVQRSWLNKASADNKPVEVIYQVWKQDYAQESSKQSAVIWDDWALGVKQLDGVIQSFQDGQKFDLATLKRIHRGLFPFYPLVNEHGDFAHEPYPGVLKPTATADQENNWWILKTPNEISDAKKIIDIENATYQKMGLLTPPPKGYPEYVSHILDVRETTDKSGQPAVGLFSGHGMVNRQNTELILDMIDQLIQQARSGEHMIWKGRLFTPAELAYFVQQAYVRVHPFYEGNGRTSRFLQELILLSFHLPHGASGDLMNIDALTESSEYYRKSIDANFSLLERMKQCADEYKSSRLGSRLKSADQSSISYSCRILADRSSAWAEMFRKNEVEQAENFRKALTDKDSNLNILDRQNDLNHENELARRSGTYKPQATSESNSKSDTQDCSKLTFVEKERCERFVAIKKKLGI